MNDEFQFCGNCGTQNLRANKFCVKCGNTLTFTSDPQEKDQKHDIVHRIDKIRVQEPSKTAYASHFYDDLNSRLSKFSDHRGTLTVQCSKYSIQLSRRQGSYKINADILNLGEDIQLYIKKLSGFGYKRHNHTIRKTYVLSNFDNALSQITDDCKIVIEEIFIEGDTSLLTLKERLSEYKTSPLDTVLDDIPAETNQNDAKKGCIPLLIIVGLIFLIFKFCGNSSSNQTNSHDLQSGNMKLNAFVYSQKYVEQNLTNPKSAEFPAADYSCSVSTKDSIYFVTSYVDAENAFGGVVRNNFVVTMKYRGGDPDDAESWLFDDVVFMP